MTVNPWDGIARILIAGGLALLTLGGLALLFSRTGWRLPGDIFIQRGNFSFFFPVVTCILLSLVLTIVVNIVLRR